jgi:tRNA nucleotidyltransferase/poly(A) polymerase
VRLPKRRSEPAGRALLVGGYVRDALLGLDPKDADIEVYGIEAAALRKLLNRLGPCKLRRRKFRVYKLVWHETTSATNSTCRCRAATARWAAVIAVLKWKAIRQPRWKTRRAVVTSR